MHEMRRLVTIQHPARPAMAPPGQAGWMRPSIKRREATYAGADGEVVQHPNRSARMLNYLPVHAFQRMPSALFLDGAATPPGQAGRSLALW